MITLKNILSSYFFYSSKKIDFNVCFMPLWSHIDSNVIEGWKMTKYKEIIGLSKNDEKNSDKEIPPQR